MRVTITSAAFVAAVALVASGAAATPALAAERTTGHALLALDLPKAKVDITAGKPAKNKKSGMFFPIASVDGDTVVLRGELVLTYGGGSQPLPVDITLDRGAKRADFMISIAGQSAPLFYSSGMSQSKPVVVVNTAKKVRTSTTIWKGVLRLDPAVAQNFNDSFGTNVPPGGKVGQFELKINTKAPCKNSACTR